LRSGRIVRLRATLVSVSVLVDSVVVVVVEPLAPIVLPLPVVPELVLVSVLVLPVAGGVPVAPIGVDWVLCWPAPVAASLDGLGGVL
jgi:hypothetical protein